MKTAPWLGHVRSETQDKILKDAGSPERINIPATEYTERGVPFSVPPGHAIEGVLIKNKNFPQGQGIFIVTRPVSEEEKKKCSHPRHPKFIKKG